MKRTTGLAAGVWAVTSLLDVGQVVYGEAGSIVGWGSMVVVPQEELMNWVAVAAGCAHSLGLKVDHSIVAWGWNDVGQCMVPEPNADFISLAAGSEHSLGLKADGSIVAWGLNNAGQCNLPVPNDGFIAIAAGGSLHTGHSLGPKADRSIIAWGDNWDGQCDVPAPNSDFVAIAAGGYHSLGLKADGSSVAWGCNNPEVDFYDLGQCNVSSLNANFVALAGGWYESLGLKGVFGDVNVDGVVALHDFDAFAHCLSGPGVLPPRGCNLSRIDADWDVDLADFAAFQGAFSPPP